MKHFFSENIILPASDIVTGRSLYKQLRFLNRSQFWSEEQLLAFQNELLKKLIYHAYHNVPFYQELFDELQLKPHDIQNTGDLIKLPVISKSDMREGIKSGKIIAKNINKKHLILNSSSGSTGEPLQFYETRLCDDVKKASAIRAWQWMDFRLGDKVLRINHVPRKGLKKKLQDYLSGNDYVYADNLNNEFFYHLTQKIKKSKPDILRITPDALSLFTNYLERTDIQFSGFKAINTTGSVLISEVREKAERHFNCEVFDSFSCEGGAVVFECSNHSCYHSAMEYAISEILDINNNPAKKGRLITTNLWNYLTPFIRYDTQDVIEIKGTQCTCGRKLLPVRQIYGRESDILITPGGKHLIVNNFTGRFQSIKEVEQFQITQHSLFKYTVLLKVNDHFNEDVRKNVKKLLHDIIDAEADINIMVVDNIPTGKSGKRRFLIRNKEVELL